MALDPALHTGRDARPRIPTRVAIVAYERKDGLWDAFVFEPAGVCPPAWESARADAEHLYLGPVRTPDELDALARQVEAKLGPEYDLVEAFREEVPGEKTGVHRRMHWLHKLGCTGYRVDKDASGRFAIRVRRRDVPALERAMKRPAEGGGPGGTGDRQ